MASKNVLRIGACLAAVILAGCGGGKTPPPAVPVPPALLGMLGIAARSITLTAEEARHLKFIRVYCDHEGAPARSQFFQMPVEPGAQTIHILAQVQEGSKVKVTLGVFREGKAGEQSMTSGEFPLPMDLKGMTVHKAPGPIAYAPDEPRMLLAAGRNSASDAMNDAANLVKFYVVPAMTNP